MPSANLKIRRARREDIDVLASLNKQLVEDEENRFQPDHGELAARMAGWLAGVEWLVDAFTDATGEIVGFLVHGRRFNPAAPGGDEIYIRLFAVDRARRREGIGKTAINLFLKERCEPGVRVMLDVLETNPAGQRFWRQAGFKPYAAILETFAPGRKHSGDSGAESC